MSKANLVKTIVILLFLAGTLFLALHKGTRPAAKAGDVAPDFTLPTLTGGSLHLHDLRPQVVVLHFWATWCPPCTTEIPSLQKFAEQVQDAGVVVISISVDRDRTALERFVRDHRLSYPVALDSDQTVATRYGTFKYPESYVIGPDGRIASKIVGAINWQDPRLLHAVQELARNKMGQLP